MSTVLPLDALESMEAAKILRAGPVNATRAYPVRARMVENSTP